MDANDLRTLERRGWPDAKIATFREAFREFLDNYYINSKDLGGHTCLGEHLYRGQLSTIDDILDGLSRDIHDFYDLKSRQLGHTTLFRAFDVFYMGIHEGLQGSVVMDTDSNKKNSRREIETAIANLPSRVKFPRVKTHDRDGVTLENDATILFLSAGTKRTSSSGTLGRSVGLSMAHCSEICSWQNTEGIESFRQSLSDQNPDRLYIWESTGRGYNDWYTMYQDAKADIYHSKVMFYGWWSKDSQRIDQSDPDFERYGRQPPTEKETEKIVLVKERHGWQITAEQLAWVRKKMDPAAALEDSDLPIEYEGGTIRLQEQAWLEEDAWQQAGATFFSPETLKMLSDKFASPKYKGYYFQCGTDFIDTKVFPAHTEQQAELKIWNEPEVGSYYVVACDPAFGTNENNDRSCIQIGKCYADGIDQVAEYASPLVGTRQLAWIIMSLAAWYCRDRGDVYLIVELNGPGHAVWDEIKSLRREMAGGYQRVKIEENGLGNVFQNVKNYVYSRPDSMASGRAWQWNTHGDTGASGKLRVLERLRDFVSNGFIHVRSAATIDEMQSFTRIDDKVQAEGVAKDDRVIALGLMVRCWEERVRRKLSTSNMTRDADEALRKFSIVSQSKLYNQNMLASVLAQNRVGRNRQAAALGRMRWRGRR